MKFYYIVINALKRKAQDYKSLGIMIAFPIVLIFIFATVFGNIDKNTALGQPEKKLIKTTIYSEADEAFNKELLIYLESTNKGNEVFFDYKIGEGSSAKETEGSDVLLSIDKTYQMSIHAKGDTQKAGVLRGVLLEFERSRALNKIKASDDIQIVPDGQLENRRYTIRTIDKSDKNFYVLSIAATMISFAILMAGSYGTTEMHDIRKAVGKRIQCTPISINTIYFGEYISGVIMAFLQGCMIVLISDAVFNIGFRNNPVQMGILVLFLSLMSVAIGICIGVIVSDEKASNGAVSIVLMILCFTSGGLNPNMELGSIVRFSPITVVNKAILALCTSSNDAYFLDAVMTAAAITTVCLLIGFIGVHFRTKEGSFSEKHN